MSHNFKTGLVQTAALAVLAALLLPAQALAQHRHNHAETQRDIQTELAADNVYKVYGPASAKAGTERSAQVAAMLRKAAITFHHALLESNYEEGYLVMELDAQDISRLQSFGFRLERADEFIATRREFLDQMNRLSLQRQQQEGMANAPEVGIQSIPNFSCYETVEETYAAAQGFTTTYPNLATWTDVGNSWQKTAGLGGYDIFVLKLTNQNITGSKPKLFVNSAIHAREYTTAPLNLAFARWLLEGYGTNADATWILDHHEVHLMLQANPDGRKRAETGLSWRKNTNQNYCGATSNTRGADLNRNFTQSWNSTGGAGSSSNQCDLTYRGPSAGSEPETQAIESYVRSLWPDRRGPAKTDAAPADTSGIHIDVHSFSQLVLWPWGDTNTPAPNGTALQTLGRKFAFFNNYTPQQSIGLYPTDGTSDAVSYGELGVAAYTFELGTSFFQSCTDYNNTIKPNNLNALIYAAKVVRTPYQTPAGPDVTSITLSGTAGTSGVPAGTAVPLSASATDTRFSNRNGTEATQNIAAGEYYVDIPPWQSGAVARAMSAADGSFNATTEGLTATIDTTGLSVGKHLVFVRSRDASGNWGPITASYLVIGTGGGGGGGTVAEVESNNTRGTAQVITPNPATVNGSIAASSDNDYYAVTVAPGRTLTATLTPPANADYDLYLYRTATGNAAASSTLGTGVVDSASLLNSGTTAATYYVRVRYYSGATGATSGRYTLQLSQ
jgi:carboxypeptidase T